MTGRAGQILFTWLVILTGFIILVRYFSALDLDLSTEFLVLIALGVLTEWLAVSFPRGKLSGGFSIVLSSYLIYGPAAAAWICSLSILFAQGIVNRGNPLRTTLFNASQYVMALFLGNLAALRFKDYSVFPGLNDVFSVCAFVCTYFLINHLLVYFYLYPQRHHFPFLAWWDTFRWDVLAYLFCTPFGVLMKFVYQQQGIGMPGVLLFFLPVLGGQLILRLYVQAELINRELLALYRVAKKASEGLGTKEVFQAVLQETRRIVPYHLGAIYLWEKEAFSVAAVEGPHAKRLRTGAILKNEGFFGQVIKNKTPEIIFDTRIDPRLNHEPGLTQVYRSFIVIPFFFQAETKGLFVLGDKRPLAFDEHHLEMLSVIMAQATLAVSNEWLLRLTKSSLQDIPGSREEK